MNLNKQLLVCFAVVTLVVTHSTFAQAQSLSQGGADSDQRLAVVQDEPVDNAPGFQACAANFLSLPAFVQTPAGVTATVALAAPTVVVLNFSTEILAPAGGTVNIDYSIDNGPAMPVGPEFFSADHDAFVTRTAVGATILPFFGPLPAGIHTIRPVLTAFSPFGTPGAVFFRCFHALP
jgi:hypothetical protein